MPETARFSPEGPSPWEGQSLVEGLTTEDVDAAETVLSGEKKETPTQDAAESASPFEQASDTSTQDEPEQNLLDPLLQAELYKKEQEKLTSVRDMIKNIPDSGEPIVVESTPPADRGDAPIREGQPSIIVEGTTPDQEHTGIIDTTALERTVEEVTREEVTQEQEEITVSGVEGLDEDTLDINPEVTTVDTPSDFEQTDEHLPGEASSLPDEEIAARLPEEGGDEEPPTLRS